MNKFILSFSAIAMLFFVACSGDSESGTPTTSYNRSSLLTHWADDIIIPSYENYQAAVNNLDNKAVSFNSEPTTAKLGELRNAWLNAYNAYQYTALYTFGKAETIFFKESANTYPTNVTGIQNNIANGGYNLSVYAQYDKQGLPALDFLINGLADNDASIVSFYSNGANAAAYRQYLTDVIGRLKFTVDAVLTDWNSGYRESYISNTGTTVSSSVNKTVNNFVKNLEKDIRTAKVGIPSGEFSGGTTFPQNVEGYYKRNISKQLLIKSLLASQDFFDGKSFGSNATGPGLKAYLDHVGAVRNGTLLSTTIDNQYNLVSQSLNTINEDFVQQINTNNTQLNAFYDVLQQNVIYTKLDMMQALNITIDYVDGDGD